MKVRNLSFTLFSVFFSLQLLAQEHIILVKPEGSKEWGFINLKDEYAIDPKFRKVGEFSPDGLAPVYEDRMYYFINTKGERLATEAKNYKLKNFLGFGIRGYEDGMAPIDIDGKWGYLNKDGKLAIGPKYDEVSEFNNGTASARLGDKWYIIDKTGKEIPVQAGNLKAVRSFSDGLAIFDNQDKQFGFINTKGEVVIEPRYLSVGDFKNGIAWARGEEKLLGYINKKGEWVIQPVYEATRDFDAKSGIARVKKDRKWFYIDKEGNALKIELERYDDFFDGLARAKKGDKVGFIGADGKWAIEAQFENARDFQNGYAAAKKDGKWGIINAKGEWVIQPKYSDMRDVVKIG